MNKKINFEFLLGIIILIITIFSFLFIVSKLNYQKKENHFMLTSNFFDLGSLDEGSTVKINGVNVGEVTKISLNAETYMAVVETTYHNQLKIPTDSTFKISNNGFIGSPYIEISIGSINDYYNNGDNTENNIDAISLEEVINNFIFK